MPYRRICLTTFTSLLAWVAWANAASSSAPANQPQSAPAGKMSFLDNGKVRIGVDLNLGGSITYLSASGSSENIVNNWDWGRQIQMSYYAGPIPFVAGNKKPHKHWEKLGWNPIQAGDCYGNRAKLLECRNDGNSLYVKCIPMQWPLDNVPGDCIFESWISLDGQAVNVRARLTNHRGDKTQYDALRQECPAVYVNAPLCNLVTYLGDKPFTGDTLNRPNHVMGSGAGDVPFLATESWAAYVRNDDWGLGVWMPRSLRFLGAFHGARGKGGTSDDPAGYISPILQEILDHNIQHEFSYTLILGSVEEIRRYVYAHGEKPSPPGFEFKSDRQHWWYHDMRDTGWPIRGELNIQLDGKDPYMISPDRFWLAKDAPRLYIRAAFTSPPGVGQVFWKNFGDREFPARNCVSLSVGGNGEYRTYEVNLADNPNYKGAITGLRFDPVVIGGPGQSVRIKSISFNPPADATSGPTSGPAN